MTKEEVYNTHYVALNNLFVEASKVITDLSSAEDFSKKDKDENILLNTLIQSFGMLNACLNYMSDNKTIVTHLKEEVKKEPTEDGPLDINDDGIIKVDWSKLKK